MPLDDLTTSEMIYASEGIVYFLELLMIWKKCMLQGAY
jgi:hypothetical protein